MNRLRRGAIRPPRFPFAAEVMHRTALRRLVAQTRAVLLSELADIGPVLIAQANLYRPDAEGETAVATAALAGWAATLEGFLRRVVGQVGTFMQEAAAAVFRAGRYADAVNKREWLRVIRQAYGVDVLKGEPRLPELLSAWENENLALIKSLPAQMVDQLRGEMTRGLTFGTDLRSLRQMVMDRTGAAESRAELIARDQIGKLNGQLGAYRQQNAGVKKYTWKTMGDERVRPTHRARNNKVYSWSQHPWPGEEIRCRCVADPVLPDVPPADLFG